MATCVNDRVKVVGGKFEGQSGVVTKLNGVKQCTVDLGVAGIHRLALTSVQAVLEHPGVLEDTKPQRALPSVIGMPSGNDNIVIIINKSEQKNNVGDVTKKMAAIDLKTAPNFAHGGRGAEGKWIRKDYEDWLRKKDVSQATIEKMNVPNLRKEIFKMCEK